MRKLAVILILLTVYNGAAQETGEDKLGAWYMYFGINKISDRFSIHSEAQFRYYETTSNFNQMLLRVGLNYHISPEAIATIGYGYIDTDNSFEDIPNQNNLFENRLFEQFILKNKVWELLFEHRFRFEQRFLHSGSTTDTQHRARYRLQITLPLTNTFFLNFYDEIFLNLQDDIFNQNRLYAALGINVLENFSVQLGYLKNHFNTTNFDRLQFGIFYNPDLRRKNGKVK
ncbi:DUF2490 domain-containing protein [uncultured Eudoraea sp.]|uniref:DUF2490 domain-containing protein n=1 Tax=uncultured Eudoraea sp. TaxID=1035614 RepID=UPI0026019ED3|nr:DUF2490 domain-containing protein [uncultured Eudoraea sp.]